MLLLHNWPIARVTPVVVRSVSKDITKNLFKAKAKLAYSGIFVAEFLTKQRADILNVLRTNWVRRMFGLIKANFDFALRQDCE